MEKDFLLKALGSIFLLIMSFGSVWLFWDFMVRPIDPNNFYVDYDNVLATKYICILAISFIFAVVSFAIHAIWKK